MPLTLPDVLILALCLATTLGAAWLAYTRKKEGRLEALAGRSLGPWMLAFSAGAEANSGFVLTGAVGMGYTMGLSAALLPLAFLIGDYIFYTFFVGRLNHTSTSSNSITMPELINKSTSNGPSKLLHLAVALVLVIFPLVYLGGQWLAAGKMGAQIFQITPNTCALIFAAVVIGYTAISGFRGAIYTDFIQGIFMVALAFGTIALTIHGFVTAHINPLTAISLWGDGPGNSPLNAFLMFASFIILAITFDIGHPQMVTRFMSAKSPADARKARNIYLAFIQLTWLTYSVLGACLHALLQNTLADPEQGLTIFITQYGFPGMLGLLIAGGIATIASTASALTATIGEMLRNDLLAKLKLPRILSLALIGVASVICAMMSSGSVFGLIVNAVSLIGATLAAPMLFIVFNRKPTTEAVLSAMILGFTAGGLWIMAGFSTILNESAPGLLTGLLTLTAFHYLAQPQTPTKKRK